MSPELSRNGHLGPEWTGKPDPLTGNHLRAIGRFIANAHVDDVHAETDYAVFSPTVLHPAVMKTTHALLVALGVLHAASGVGVTALAQEKTGVVVTLPTITVEGSLPKRPLPRTRMIQVPAGVGRQELDPPRNELGVELKNMERVEELSLERRVQPWWLRSGAPSEDWRGQIQADLSLDQKIRLRSEGLVSGVGVNVEGGYFRDHRDLVLLVNSVNPHDTSYDRQQAVSNLRDRSYFTLGAQGISWQALGDFDFREEDVHAGALLAGRKNNGQQALSAKWQSGNLQALPFAQLRQGRFDSAVSPRLSNQQRGSRFGVQGDFLFGDSGYSIEPILAFESVGRIFSDQTRADFQRVSPALIATKGFATESLELTFNVGAEAALDQIDGVAGRKSTDTFLWNFAGEISSSKARSWGVAGRFRRFAIMPTPSQLFGDGAILTGTGDLPPETGLRVAAGPWFRTEEAELDLAAFSERSANAPVVVAVSPVTARTLPIGGVWARGVELRGLLRRGLWTVESSYGYLEALNDSEVEWQRGRPLPGRPRHTFKTNINYGRRGWKSGVSYVYRSDDALDLTGLWFSPPRHALDAYVGYGARTWEARLMGGQLMAGLNSLPTGQFAGRASPDLLQPTIEQTEVRLQCEFLM